MLKLINVFLKTFLVIEICYFILPIFGRTSDEKKMLMSLWYDSIGYALILIIIIGLLGFTINLIQRLKTRQADDIISRQIITRLNWGILTAILIIILPLVFINFGRIC
jgi:hypothetical protein